MAKELLRETLDALILEAVSMGPVHSAGVLVRIRELSSEPIRVEQGIVDSVLDRFERQGLIEATWGLAENQRRVRYYRLTQAGTWRLGEANGDEIANGDPSPELAESLERIPFEPIRPWSSANGSPASAPSQAADGAVAPAPFTNVTRVGGRVTEAVETPPLPWIQALKSDFRFALRALAFNPSYAFLASLTLAIAVGAHSAAFSLVDAVLFRPLPYPQPERLHQIVTAQTSAGQAISRDTSHSGATWELVRDRLRSAGAAAYTTEPTTVNFGGGGAAETVKEQRVSAGFFRIMGLPPRMGREFAPGEDIAGGAPVAIISYDFWRSSMAADPGILDRVVTIRGQRHTVVGVANSVFQATSDVDVWTPLRPSRAQAPDHRDYTIVARLYDSASLRDANGELLAISGALLGQGSAASGTRLEAVPWQGSMTLPYRPPLLLIWLGFMALLALGCANVETLFRSQAMKRRRELATRYSLGESPVAIWRQMIVEGLLLAILGGFAGVGVAALFVGLFRDIAREVFGVWQVIAIDLRVLAVTAAISLAAGLLISLSSARGSARVGIRGLFGAEGGSEATQKWLVRTRRVQTFAQVMIATLLLIVAAMMGRSLLRTEAQVGGFGAGNLLAASITLDDARYTAASRINELFNQSLRGMRSIPGVESAGVGLILPYDAAMDWPAVLPITAGIGGGDGGANYSYVTPGFFETLGIQLIGGRLLSESDGSPANQVAVVNRALATRYFAGADPVGRNFNGHKIVGVVENAPHRAGREPSSPLRVAPMVYAPARQVTEDVLRAAHTAFSPSWVVRTAYPQAGLAQAIQHVIRETDPQLPVSRFRTLEQMRRGATRYQRSQTGLMVGLALLALVLAAIGLYIQAARFVVENRRELEIRSALGSPVLRSGMVVARPVFLAAAAGVLAGCAVALAAGGTLRAVARGVDPFDIVTFAAAIMVMLLVAASACALPTLRLPRFRTTAE